MENKKSKPGIKTCEFRVLWDIKCFLSQFYKATVELDGDKVLIKFINGQNFEVAVKEKK